MFFLDILTLSGGDKINSQFLREGQEEWGQTSKAIFYDFLLFCIKTTKLPTYKYYYQNIRPEIKLNIPPTENYQRKVIFGYKAKIFPFYLLDVQFPKNNFRSWSVQYKLIIGPTFFVRQKVRRSES